MTATELKQKLLSPSPPRVVDVRSVSEFATGHIPGSLNIPLEQVETRVEDVKAGGPVVLVCQSGVRAVKALQILDGYLSPELLNGGMNCWIREGFAVVSNAASSWALERQVRLGAGVLGLTGVLLSVAFDPVWIWLSGFVWRGPHLRGVHKHLPDGHVAFEDAMEFDGTISAANWTSNFSLTSIKTLCTAR
jgi:rhodanese-related sulfurtransferase